MNLLRPLLIATLMLAQPRAHATSFDCNKGRSLTEKMICNDPALSKLDDTLGQLYWKARRRVIHRRAFLIDSDNRWAWREANCRDAACLEAWYATRIEDLRTLIGNMEAQTPLPPATPVKPHTGREPLRAPVRPVDMATHQCTATNPGIVMNEPCSAVIRESGSRWINQPRGGDWFCGVATLEPAQIQADAAE